MENPLQMEVLMGKSSINGPFSIVMLVYQRVSKPVHKKPTTPVQPIQSDREHTSCGPVKTLWLLRDAARVGR